MPAANEYMQDASSPEYRALEEAHAHEYDARAKRFAEHWAYYNGEMPEPLVRQKDGVNDNIIMAKIDQIADKSVSFLIGDGIAFNASGDGDQTTPEDKAIEQLWLENQGKLLQHNIALAGTMAGHPFVRLMPREGQMPRIVNLNPAHCSVFWDAMDVDRALWYRLQYTAGESGKRVDYVRGRPRGQAWDHEPDTWYEVVYNRNRGVFAEWRFERMGLAWEYPFSPIIEWQNMPRPFVAYGSDDVHKAIALNNSVNFIASNWNRILKHFADPKLIGLGFEADTLEPTQVGGLYVVNKPKNEADIFALEMQSDMEASRELLSIALREIWQSARLVDPQTIKDQVGKLTNFGLRVLYSDALAKVETKRLLYEEAFVEIIQRGLTIAGLAVPETINTTWPDVLPEDADAISTALLAELAAGVIDKQTYRELRNYDHELIQKRMAGQAAGEDNIGARLLAAFEGGGRNGR